VLAPLISPETSAVPLDGRTGPGVIEALVQTANRTWQIYDLDRVIAAIRERETESSTAQVGGVAVPHPGRRLADALGEPLVAFGRTASGIPFGDPRGGLTDLFFLVLCKDESSHLRVLARLSRLFLRDGFLDQLRDADSAETAVAVIVDAEIKTG
jgi:PTS system nitrogen regulatory IIA component